MKKFDSEKVGFASLLISIGIVFGDIGTSPLYVFTAITGGNSFDPILILGSLSCITWTLLIIASFKYVFLALNADNNGEGGIFALYALLRKTKSKWILIPALIGCATLISDGFITPAISISSAIEGLEIIYPNIPTLPIVCVIIVLLFSIQQFGTKKIGGIFGPVMLAWFLLLGVLGLNQLMKDPDVLRAINPIYAIQFLMEYPEAIWILGAVFLCTTGAEALYSDLGHCGKKNIRITWIFVFSMLLLNYYGQAAYCLSLPEGASLTSVFYSTVPEGYLPWVIGLATLATVIASQALITGIFTLINEAVKLRLWTRLKVKYPSTHKGQVYIPFINYFLMFGCLLVILIFRRASNMEAAYGLAITIDMLMTSMLLGYLLWIKHKKKKLYVIAVITLFITVEATFLFSNLNKIPHGGWFTLLLALTFFLLLYAYHKARDLRDKVTEYQSMKSLSTIIEKIQADDELPYLATNLVYPARSTKNNLIDTTIAFSICRMQPKRSAVYWFVHIDTNDSPYGVEYKVTTVIPKKSFYVKLNLGFKEPHVTAKYMSVIHQEMMQSKELDGRSVYSSMVDLKSPPDFRYILINSRVSSDHKLSMMEHLYIRIYRFLKPLGLDAMEDFGLDMTNTTIEHIPINISAPIMPSVKRIY